MSHYRSRDKHQTVGVVRGEGLYELIAKSLSRRSGGLDERDDDKLQTDAAWQLGSVSSPIGVDL